MERLLKASPEEIRDNPEDFSVKQLGEPTIASPLKNVIFLSSKQRVSFFSNSDTLKALNDLDVEAPAFVAAGPRRRIFHNPAWTRAAIVTCGGLCPGLNDVVKSLVNTLWYSYGVKNIIGIPYGYRGLVPGSKDAPINLTPDVVDDIHGDGGTILGSSRGQQDTKTIVRALASQNINILFTIGGDGTQRGAHEIANEILDCGLNISVIGVPKTIDNDLNFTERTFGFETSVYAAAPVIGCAHNEANGAYNGIGLVRLMGRDSGFIAATATLANSVVNFCLVPEVPLELEGKNGFLAALERRLQKKRHAVVVVAEGVANTFFKEGKNDASGNKIPQDIGPYLKKRIEEYFGNRKVPLEHTVKYFDPSYMIRSVAARGTDAVFCLHLAQNAVHAAMAGYTDIVIGFWHEHFTCVPIRLAIRDRRRIDPQSQLWQSVLMTTRQQEYFGKSD